MERGTLSPRELEILTWTAKGKTYWEIARILGIAYASVHSHINSLRLKLNAVNTTKLSREVMSLDLSSSAQRSRGS